MAETSQTTSIALFNGEEGMSTQNSNERLPDRGDKAPDFRLPSTTGGTIALHELTGRPVILAFYPADWSPVCGEQMVLYNEVLPMFEEHSARVLGISVDGMWSHKAYAEQRNLRFPLLSDFEPKGEVSRRYAVYDETKGRSERALFVIDRDGVIRWKHVSPPNVNPGADGILRALEELD
jgi:peroxiredoxin